MTETTFAGLGIAEALLRALTARNHTTPTPIQQKAIPPALEGRDIIGLAQTGTGKTAAFALPILQALAASPAKPMSQAPRALILAPTRELAAQISESFRAYGRDLPLRHTVIFGGVGQRPQADALRRGVDIVVATPGRLKDLLQQRLVRLDQVTHLVLDEADRMLDMGFIHDVRTIIRLLPKNRQAMMFSATMPKTVAELAGGLLQNPVRVEVTPEVITVDKIEQRILFTPAADKRNTLVRLLGDATMTRVIVFTRTKHGADRVTQHLEKAGIMAAAIHGNKTQGARVKALDGFRSGRMRVLVATDIAARGIDVREVSHVINFELPNEPESYVHRIGRTARAGASGIAISLVDNAERGFLRDIERLTRRKLTPTGTQLQPQAEGAAPQAPRSEGHRAEGPRNDARPQGQRPQGQRPHGQKAHGHKPGGHKGPHGQRPAGQHQAKPQGGNPNQGHGHQGGNDRPAHEPVRPAARAA